MEYLFGQLLKLSNKQRFQFKRKEFCWRTESCFDCCKIAQNSRLQEVE